MHLCLFEDHEVYHLSPIAQTRGVYLIRTGALNNLVRLWETFDRPSLSLHARPEIEEIVRSQTGLQVNEGEQEQGYLFVNGRITLLPLQLVARLSRKYTKQKEAKVFLQNGTVVAAWAPDMKSLKIDGPVDASTFEGLPTEEVTGVEMIGRLWQLVDELQPRLKRDLARLSRNFKAETPPQVHASVTLYNSESIFIGPDVEIAPGAIINAADGPVFIARGVKIMEGAIVRGPIYLGKRSTVKPRADVSRSAIGPTCKAGGEVTDVIMQSFSNKAHEGFLGHSYVGSWCNIGAGTNASNLRNDYKEATLFNEFLNVYEATGRQFMGVIMADYCKIGISSMVNTASVFGVGCNLFGSEFLPRYLPSFSWGSPNGGFEPYRLDKAYTSIERLMARRARTLSNVTKNQLEKIFNAAHASAGKANAS